MIVTLTSQDLLDQAFTLNKKVECKVRKEHFISDIHVQYNITIELQYWRTAQDTHLHLVNVPFIFINAPIWYRMLRIVDMRRASRAGLYITGLAGKTDINQPRFWYNYVEGTTFSWEILHFLIALKHLNLPLYFILGPFINDMYINH